MPKLLADSETYAFGILASGTGRFLILVALTRGRDEVHKNVVLALAVEHGRDGALDEADVFREVGLVVLD